jgi:drug/metabolite transporter (DMT)-like permease
MLPYYGFIALAVLPASVQYPFVTGGRMVVSCVISLLRRQRPTWREWTSVLLSFAGIMILIFIP